MMPAEKIDPVEQMVEWFEFEHLPDSQKEVVRICQELAIEVVSTLPHNDETYVGLRKLREAKDCFVRASIAQVGLHRWLSQTRWARGSITDVP